MLQPVLGEDVEVKEVFYFFPLGMHIYDVRLHKKLSIKKISTQLSLASIFKKSLVLQFIDIEEPQVDIGTYWNEFQESRNDRSLFDNKFQMTQMENKMKALDNLNIDVNHLHVQNGQINNIQLFLKKYPKLKYPLHLTKINVEVSKNSLTGETADLAFKMDFNFRGDKNPLEKNRLQADGLMNLPKGDLKGHLKIYKADDSGKLLADFMADKHWLKVNGKMNFKETFMQNLPGGLFVQNIFFEEGKPEDLKMEVSFSLTANLDDLTLNQLSFSGEVVSDKVEK